MQTGHVGLKIDVSGDGKEKRNKEQEPTTSRGIKEMFERFYEVAGYFIGLLDFKGNILFVLLQSAFRTKFSIQNIEEQGWNYMCTYKRNSQAQSVITVAVKTQKLLHILGVRL